MDMLSIFIDVLSVAIFLCSLIVSYLFYQKITDRLILLTKVSALTFNLCILMSAGYFVYSMSAGMTIKNIGYYFTVLLLPLIYAALFSIFVKVYIYKNSA
jgi:hypothetical protein